MGTLGPLTEWGYISSFASRVNDPTFPVGREPASDVNQQSDNVSCAGPLSWYVTHEYSVVRLLLCIGDSIPDCMITFGGDGRKDQL